MGSKYVTNNAWRDFKLSGSEFATIVPKTFNVKFTTKIDFSDRAFYIFINDPDIGSLNFFHTLFDKYLDHMLVKFELNRIIRNKQNFELFGKNKNR